MIGMLEEVEGIIEFLGSWVFVVKQGAAIMFGSS